MFTFNVDRIPSAGIAVDGVLPRSTVAFLLGDHLRPEGEAATIRFEVHRRGTNILVDGEAQFEYAYECGRCAETFTRSESVPFALACVQGAEEATSSTDSDDIDVEGLDDESLAAVVEAPERDVMFYTGANLDLESAISEQIVLTLPAWPVCQDDCKGLCANCGANLNHETCTCATDVIDPRWAALGTLKAAIGGNLPRS